jgi:N-acylneuraminate cytidylyltransferase
MAKREKKIEKIIFSSDSEKYLKIAVGLGIDKANLHLRAKKFATSRSSSEETLLDVIKSKSLYKRYKNIILLQATSPLRTFLDITKAIQKFEKSKKSSLVSTLLIPFKIAP